MNTAKLRFEPMSKRYINEVARLHIMGLTRDFSGWAGQRIMALFYRELISTQEPPPGFVALVGERVVGFAVAVEDAGVIRRRVLVRRGWWLAVLAVAQFATQPRSLLRRLGRNLTQPRVRKHPGQRDALETYCPAPRIEFRGIVVDPSAHAPGAALGLMRTRLDWAKAAGYKSIYFQIEPDNTASIKLCQWAGAQPVPEDVPQRRLRFYMVLA